MGHCVCRLDGGWEGGRWRLGGYDRCFAVNRKKIAYNGIGIRVPVYADGQSLRSRDGRTPLMHGDATLWGSQK